MDLISKTRTHGFRELSKGTVDKFFFIIGSFLATILIAKKVFSVPISLTGALLIAAGVPMPSIWFGEARSWKRMP